MSRLSLDQVAQEAKTLAPEEQRRLKDMLEEWLAEPRPQMTEAEFEQHLVARGLLARPRSPRAGRPAEFKPIQVKGKPVSETIVEERR